MSTIVGVFENFKHLEKASNQLKNNGLWKKEKISVLSKERDEKAGVKDDISGGVVTGGVLGGLAGLLIGAGTLMIPGIGIIAAAGPITGLISGAVTGGIVGGLIDLGIPEQHSKEYEDEIKKGRSILSIKTDESEAKEIESVLKSSGATRVDTF